MNFCTEGHATAFGADDFHRMCDNKGETLVLIKKHKWARVWRLCFYPLVIVWCPYVCTRLIPLHTYQYVRNPAHKISTQKRGRCECYLSFALSNGPIFCVWGKDICVYPNCNAASDTNAYFPVTYTDSTGKGYSIFTSNQSNRFKVDGMEVFRICVCPIKSLIILRWC